MAERIDNLAQAKRILTRASNDCVFGPARAMQMVDHAREYLQKQIDELAAPIFAADEAVNLG